MKQSVRNIRASSRLSDEQVENLVGSKLKESDYDELIQDSVDVFDEQGNIILCFRKSVLDPALCERAKMLLNTIKQTTNNRGMATGKGLAKPFIKKDGTVSKSNSIPSKYAVNSAIIGYFDRYPRFPFCRQTAFTAQETAKWNALMPFFQRVSQAYSEIAPEKFAIQKNVVDKTSKDFVIPNTVFTTITVNKNWSTAVHTDQGDLKSGLSSILVLRSGDFSGCNLVFPKFRIAVDLRQGDLLLFDSHHAHGNTPLIGSIRSSLRISCVCYYRERMIDCGTAAEELEFAKQRLKGTRLYGKISG